jgi:hypothetical protein
MKKIFVIAFVVSVFVTEFFSASLVVAQNNRADSSRKPFITPIGTSFGEIASAKIDGKGGTIKSADGNLEVIVPDNALDSATTISIQSTHNDLNENDEGAYQLEPSGIYFKNPVKLIFHYTGNNDNAGLKSIAWQDDRGQWRQLKKVVIDTAHKTITGLAPHFSNWARFDQLYIRPVSASVKVNKSLTLIVFAYGNDNDLLAPPLTVSTSTDDDLLAPPAPISSDDDLLAPPAPKPSFYTSDWTVNGSANGNNEVGIVSKLGNASANYEAPATMPDDNPVAVSVQVYSDKLNKKLLLTSNITIIGGKYHFTYIHIDEGDGCFALVDSSSCIVNLDTDNPSITNIINYPPWSDWPNCSKACKTEWTNKETVKGLVEINGLASSAITPPRNKGGVTGVYISLVPAMGSTASAIEHCKDGDHTIPSRPYPADPKYISFDIINRDNLTIHFGGKSGTNELVVQGHNEKTMIYMYKVN